MTVVNIGDIVWYHDNTQGTAKYPAIITSVYENDVDLVVFSKIEGGSVQWLSNVPEGTSPGQFEVRS